MKSYRKLGHGNLRVISGLISLALALIYGGVAQAAPQYALTCDACHRMPPLDSPSGTRDPQTGAFKGNHETHSASSPASCTKCHSDEIYGPSHLTKTIRVRDNINAVPTSTYSRSFFNQTSVPPNPLGTCCNVNCHFELRTDPWGAPLALTYATLGVNGTTCGKCHDLSPNDGNHPAASGPGKKHGDYYGTGTGSCVVCHPDHTAEGSGTRPFAHATQRRQQKPGASVRCRSQHGRDLFEDG